VANAISPGGKRNLSGGKGKRKSCKNGKVKQRTRSGKSICMKPNRCKWGKKKKQTKSGKMRCTGKRSKKGKKSGKKSGKK